MNKRKKYLIIVMVIMTLLLSIPSALAYFSTYTREQGTALIHLREQTKIKEEKIDGGKHVSIVAMEGSDPVYVRVRAFAVEDIMKLLDHKGNGWTKEGDWYVYDKVLHAGEEASIDILFKAEGLTAEQKEALEGFNVVVVYEFIPATSDLEGNFYPEWDKAWTIEKGGAGA